MEVLGGVQETHVPPALNKLPWRGPRRSQLAGVLVTGRPLITSFPEKTRGISAHFTTRPSQASLTGRGEEGGLLKVDFPGLPAGMFDGNWRLSSDLRSEGGRVGWLEAG